ncbi:MAG: hypothetical protein KME26_33580, partial [Oscillatoria princeps RMCB-10]|nr:hypothetical protein [Oscillatoria princeps RMCB-10]
HQNAKRQRTPPPTKSPASKRQTATHPTTDKITGIKTPNGNAPHHRQNHRHQNAKRQRTPPVGCVVGTRQNHRHQNAKRQRTPQ